MQRFHVFVHRMVRNPTDCPALSCHTHVIARQLRRIDLGGLRMVKDKKCEAPPRAGAAPPRISPPKPQPLIQLLLPPLAKINLKNDPEISGSEGLQPEPA